MRRNILLIIPAVFIAFQISGQSIDYDRMNKDIAVSENVLSTLFNESGESRNVLVWSKNQIDGDYISDYGVIFNVNHGFFNRLAYGSNNLYVFPDSYRGRSGRDKLINQNSQNILDEKELDELKKEAKEAEEKQKKKFIEASKDFMADYAHLISQLKPNDNIMIRARSAYPGIRFAKTYTYSGTHNGDLALVDGNEDEKDTEITIEVKVSEIQALRKAQITRDQFLKKVKVTELERSYEKQSDLEMISSMFHRLYQRDLSDTYYTLSHINYSSVNGLGVTFEMKVYSSFGSERAFFMPSTGDKGLSLEERNKKVQDLLPEFEKGFKENMVNYGRSIKSLDANELLIFEVKLTQCKECPDFPKALKFSVKKSVLDDFNSGKISEAQAVQQVKLTREK